ncbi:MAG TPA: SDR family NAD(P)-dependent oxidoreductase [Thermohalobaculum sp.]|nr:SDR family NAD(P)-dependent oxidoreductase [Thermohalobaculum sp.]
MKPNYSKALIIGAGAGLSASLARLFGAKGLKLALAARDTGKLAALGAETGASIYACDSANHGQVAALFAALDAHGAPDVVVYNPSARVRGPLIDLDPQAVAHAVQVTAVGAFFAAQEAVKRMQPAGHGAVLFTGASAGVKGYAQSAPFAMGKFALRGLAQSMARELHPKGIHIGHFVIDGGIRSGTRQDPPDSPDSMLDPDAIALSYWHFLEQDRSSWSWEIELRPWVERF